MSPGPSVTVKVLVQKNHSVNFMMLFYVKHKRAVCRLCADKLNKKYIRTCSMLCSSIPKRWEHTKNNERVKNIFITGFYNILRLFSLQLPILTWKFLLKFMLKYSWFQNCYYWYLYENFIIAQWVHQNRVDLRRQVMKKIIPSLLIWHYVTFFHPNWRICMHSSR